MAYGIEVNMAVTYDDENNIVNGGVHVTDSEGLDFSTQSTGETLDNMIESLMCDALEQLATARMSPVDRKIAELEAQLEELYTQKENEEYGLKDENPEEECSCCGQCDKKELEEIDKDEFTKMLDNILNDSAWKNISFKKQFTDYKFNVII